MRIEHIVNVLQVFWIILDETTDLRQLHIILPLLPVDVNHFVPLLKDRVCFVEFALFLNFLRTLMRLLLQLLGQSLAEFDRHFFAVLIQYDDR